MKNGYARLALVLVTLSFWAVQAGAESVDDRINALEQELSALKSQQIDLKKEGRRRQRRCCRVLAIVLGNGMMIEAADKSWGIRFSMETGLRMLFESGQDQVGRTNGEIMLRRWRPYIYYCIDNCLYEIEIGLGYGRIWNR